MHYNSKIAGLLVSTALSSALFVQTAHAQGQAGAQAKPASTQLEDVVVTATRQTSTANKVALSIAAVTQKTLDEQGIKNVNDLQRVKSLKNYAGWKCLPSTKKNTKLSY